LLFLNRGEEEGLLLGVQLVETVLKKGVELIEVISEALSGLSIVEHRLYLAVVKACLDYLVFSYFKISLAPIQLNHILICLHPKLLIDLVLAGLNFLKILLLISKLFNHSIAMIYNPLQSFQFSRVRL